MAVWIGGEPLVEVELAAGIVTDVELLTHLLMLPKSFFPSKDHSLLP